MTRALALLFLILAAAPAAAQDRQPPSLDLFAGTTGFADDGIVNEGSLGAAGRWYVSRRLSAGPEFTFVFGESHSHRILTANLMFEFRGPAPHGRPRLTPYVVIGGGVFNTADSFSGEAFNSYEGAFTAGGGVRAPIGDRASIGADVRMGWEPHIRLTGFVSTRLGR